MQEVAQKLNVAHVLEGSVRKSGNKVRITAQLIKAADGYHVWSETYDRTLDDIFVVQDDIAGAVVKALQVTLVGTALASRSKPRDPEAYNLALQGRYFVDRGGKEDLERSIDYFRQSLQRDPGYAPAWAGLSQAYAWQADQAFVPVAEGYPRAREAAEKALALDPRLADAHLAMGWIHSYHDWDWAAADASFRKALELEPGNAKVLRAVGGQAMNLGRWDESIDALNKAIERDPLGPNNSANSVSYSRPSAATRRPSLRSARPSSSIPAERVGTCRSGLFCSCRVSLKPPCGKCSRKRRELATLRVTARIPRTRPAQRVQRGAGGLEEQVRRGNGLSGRRSACLPRRGRPGLRVARARL